MSGPAPGTPSRPFTPDEIALLKARYATDGAVKIARELGRARQTICSKARRLGLSHSPHKSSRNRYTWTAAQDALIRQHYPDTSRRLHGSLNMTQLARKIGAPVGMVRQRAYELGLVTEVVKSPPWTEDEIEFVLEHAHLATTTLVRRMKQRGWARSAAAIKCMQHRHQVQVTDAEGGYSARRLAELLGIGHTVIYRWIKNGEIKAASRGDAPPGEVLDRWIITPGAVYRFLAEHPLAILLHKADQLWLLSLLTTRGFKDAPPITRQSSAGLEHEAASGYDEYEVRA